MTPMFQPHARAPFAEVSGNNTYEMYVKKVFKYFEKRFWGMHPSYTKIFRSFTCPHFWPLMAQEYVWSLELAFLFADGDQCAPSAANNVSSSDQNCSKMNVF